MQSGSLESRLAGTPRFRFWQELFGNSAQFPIANILLEMLIEGLAPYLRAPDAYAILLAAVAQAYFLSRWQLTARPRRFWGNLIGPALYTLIEATIEGPAFFVRPHHLAYWGFALAFGVLQSVRLRLSGVFNAAALILENVARAGILLVMYAVFESFANPKQTVSVAAFFADTAHQFVALAILLVGLSVALADLTAQRYLDLLRRTSAQLKTYSEWLLGRDLLNRIVADPAALTLTRRERAVLFMDIRGFTRWSETRAPEEVVAMLNHYYFLTETALARHAAIKFKFSADEAMAIFASAGQAAAAALELREEINRMLSAQQLGVGIGLHTGLLVEGLLGSAGVKFYDVIGDTVNTAKRIESAAGAGEVWISENVRQAMGETARLGPSRQITAKGKEEPLTVHRLE
jgi:class 3 adenylate cyclase